MSSKSNMNKPEIIDADRNMKQFNNTSNDEKQSNMKLQS